MARTQRGVEEEVAWQEERGRGARNAARNVRLPIGGRSVYVTRDEARYLARVAQECAVLQMSAIERDARLQAELETLCSVANNPLLGGATRPAAISLQNNIFLTA